tara:strand:+ start:177 stop:338 length:162 start_codon:yes stop_codon:yes gene_type:complete
MQVGDLVRFDYDHVIGVVMRVDYDFEYGMMYRVAFVDGSVEWCIEDDLEVVCE